jgi:transcriptional regulator with XRE-family HTH domain
MSTQDLGLLTFGEIFAELRVQRGHSSLREFCRAHAFDPARISKLERGKTPPPKDPEKLESYAVALGIRRDSEEWSAFERAASLARKQIPEESLQLLEDEETAPLLPVFFRSLCEKPLSAAQLQKLIDLVRSA